MRMSYIAPALFAAFATAGIAADLPRCPPPLEFTDRKAELHQAIRSARNESAGRLLSRELNALRSVAPDRRAQDMFDGGRAAIEAGDLALAKRRLDALAAYCPDFAEGWHARAHLDLRLGEAEMALANLDRVLDLAPYHGIARGERAALLWHLGRFDEAQRALEAALAINPWLPQRALRAVIPGPGV